MNQYINIGGKEYDVLAFTDFDDLLDKLREDGIIDEDDEDGISVEWDDSTDRIPANGGSRVCDVFYTIQTILNNTGKQIRSSEIYYTAYCLFIELSEEEISNRFFSSYHGRYECGKEEAIIRYAKDYLKECNPEWYESMVKHGVDAFLDLRSFAEYMQSNMSTSEYGGYTYFFRNSL